MLRFAVLFLISAVASTSMAISALEGTWNTEIPGKTVEFVEFGGSLTMNTQSFYPNGAAINWFYEFDLPPGRDAQPGEILQGRVRSVDGFYGCVFDMPAHLELDVDGRLKMNFPILSYHVVSYPVNGPVIGVGSRTTVSWNGWGWIQQVCNFPIQQWYYANACVVDQQNWITNALTRPYQPVPPQPTPEPTPTPSPEPDVAP
jgi:hypothetical protein